jgi:hypothetical protein
MPYPGTLVPSLIQTKKHGGVKHRRFPVPASHSWTSAELDRLSDCCLHFQALLVSLRLLAHCAA